MGLFRVARDGAGMVCQDRLDKLQAKGLWETGKPEVLGPLRLGQKAEIVEYSIRIHRSWFKRYDAALGGRLTHCWAIKRFSYQRVFVRSKSGK